MEGLEPTHRKALDPKSSVSTNFTTSACSYIMSKNTGLKHFWDSATKALAVQ
jgi:hypothetical protein